MLDKRTHVSVDGCHKLHPLKTHPEPFKAIWDGRKRFDFRKNDRGFQVGDTLKLFEYDPDSDSESGRFVFCDVTYVIEGQFGVPHGYCVMSLSEPLRCIKQNDQPPKIVFLDVDND
jgi:hypothetical protein